MSATTCVELIVALTIPIALCVIIAERICTKKGVGVRTIQLVAVSMFVPLVIILALERILDGSVVAALVGAFVGYLFSNIGEFDRNRNNN